MRFTKKIRCYYFCCCSSLLKKYFAEKDAKKRPKKEVAFVTIFYRFTKYFCVKLYCCKMFFGVCLGLENVKEITKQETDRQILWNIWFSRTGHSQVSEEYFHTLFNISFFGSDFFVFISNSKSCISFSVRMVKLLFLLIFFSFLSKI